MHETAFLMATRPVAWSEVVLASAGLALLLLVILTVLSGRARREWRVEAAVADERAREMDDKMAELARIQAEMTGRLQTVAEVFGTRQTDVARLLAERIEGLQHRMGQGLEANARRQTEGLSQFHERLAVIDAAQKNLTDLAGEMVGLKEILSNKQARGAYGQGRMEAIVRDGLPGGAYAFQATLSNRTRPDCVLRLPGDPRALVIDAKFPLEGFSALRVARGEEARGRAAQKVRTDVAVHIRDMAQKYLIPGETQDMALMFVPSESIYADLQEHFEDMVQRAHRARIVILSPSLLALAIQVVQALARDARIRDEAKVIQVEVTKLLEDVSRLGDRVAKLDAHFTQARDDVSQIKTSTEKIARRGGRIAALEFEEAEGGADLFAPPRRSAAE